jgi:uncharacterized protein (DUF2336 family)
MRPLIQELRQALAEAPASRYLVILKSLTGLFLDGASTYSLDHVAVFDDIMSCLIEKIDREAVIELSCKLATVGNAPTRVIGRLSRDDDMAIAGPILERSDALSDETLVEIAATKSQYHLSAIAGRSYVSEPVTNALIDRGNANVKLNVTKNEGARLSDVGFVKLISQSRSDKDLATALAARKDLPPELLPFLNLRHA